MKYCSYHQRLLSLRLWKQYKLLSGLLQSAVRYIVLQWKNKELFSSAFTVILDKVSLICMQKQERKIEYFISYGIISRIYRFEEIKKLRFSILVISLKVLLILQRALFHKNGVGGPKSRSNFLKMFSSVISEIIFPRTVNTL